MHGLHTDNESTEDWGTVEYSGSGDGTVMEGESAQWVRGMDPEGGACIFHSGTRGHAGLPQKKGDKS